MRRTRMALAVASLVVAVVACLTPPVVGARDGSARAEAVAWKEKGRAIGETSPNSDEEAACYEKAVALDPSLADAWFNLGLVNQAQRRWDKAAEGYRRCVDLAPGDAEARYNLGIVLCQRPGREYEARKHLNGYLELCESSGREDPGKRQQAMQTVQALEETIAAALGTVPDYTGAASQTIAQQLTQRLKRGASPYEGPRIPMTIRFETGSAEIRAESLRVLEVVAEALGNPALVGQSIAVEGHADSRGEWGYNQRLSEQRAQSVRRYLRERLSVRGVTLEARGWGEDRPLVPNTGEENWAKNRRVELINETEHARMRKEVADDRVRRKRGGPGPTLVEELY